MSKGFIQHVDVVSLSAALQCSKTFWSVITVIYYHVPCATQIIPNLPNIFRIIISHFGISSQPTKKKHGMIGAVGMVGLIARPLSMLILRRSGRGMRNWPSTTSSLPQAAEDGDGWTKLATLVDKIWTTMIKFWSNTMTWSISGFGIAPFSDCYPDHMSWQWLDSPIWTPQTHPQLDMNWIYLLTCHAGAETFCRYLLPGMPPGGVLHDRSNYKWHPYMRDLFIPI